MRTKVKQAGESILAFNQVRKRKWLAIRLEPIIKPPACKWKINYISQSKASKTKIESTKNYSKWMSNSVWSDGIIFFQFTQGAQNSFQTQANIQLNNIMLKI